MKKVSTTKKVKSTKKKPTQLSKLKGTIKDLKEEVLVFKDKNLQIICSRKST